MSNLCEPFMSDELLMSIAANATEPHERALAREVIRRRLDDPTDSDRTALATAVRELKERRGTYETQLRRFRSSGSDPEVIATWERAVAQVEEAIGAVERLAGGS